jgi:NADH:ubiquinone oxidoreductase subunit K
LPSPFYFYIENSLKLERHTEDVEVEVIPSHSLAMHLQSILLFTAILALISAAKQRSHILIAILSLEATSLVLATLYASNFSQIREDYLGIILLTLAAAETASALSLLSTLSRFSGSDNLSSCSFSSF